MMERRRSVRAYVRIPVQYSAQGAGTSKSSTLTRDISPDGLALILAERLAGGTPVQLEVRFPEEQRTINARANVIWQEEISGNAGTNHARFATGLQFTEVDLDGKQYLESLVLKVLKQRSGDANASASSLVESKLGQTERQFVFEKRVFLKDTNAEGNVYFAHFFEWQGEAREEFFRQHVPDHMQILQSGVRLITVNAWISFKQSAFLFQEILIDVKTTHLKQMSLELVFTFIQKDTGEVIASGGQKLAFADPSGKPMAIPPSIRENAKHFLIDAAPESADIYERMRGGKTA